MLGAHSSAENGCCVDPLVTVIVSFPWMLRRGNPTTGCLASWGSTTAAGVLWPWPAAPGLTLVWTFPLQNHCIDGERGGWRNPADQRWTWWLLLPLWLQLLEWGW